MRPIGIFDSGVGGLTVLAEVRKKFPRADIFYFGDTARVPYGDRSREIVTQYATECADFLMEFPLQALVIACHTASAFVRKTLRSRYQIPVIDVIQPAIEEGVRCTKNGQLALMATRASVASGEHLAILSALSNKCTLSLISCPLLVPLIEEGWVDHPSGSLALQEYLTQVKKSRADTLILGCTHYPHIRSHIENALGLDIEAIIDPSPIVACQLEEIIDPYGQGRTLCFLSDSVTRFKALAERLMPNHITQPIEYIEKKWDQKNSTSHSSFLMNTTV